MIFCVSSLVKSFENKTSTTTLPFSDYETRRFAFNPTCLAIWAWAEFLFSIPLLPQHNDRREILSEEVLLKPYFVPQSYAITHWLLQVRLDGGGIMLHVLRRILDFASACSGRVRIRVCTSEHQSDMTSYLHWLPEIKAPGSVSQASITSERRWGDRQRKRRGLEFFFYSGLLAHVLFFFF